MTRKDTIMIAVLVNAALLVGLFVTAIKTDRNPQVHAEKPIAAASPVALPVMEKKEIKKTQGDEIDQVLKDFSENKVTATTNKPKQKIDFAKELEAITKAAAEPKKEVVAAKNYTEVTVQKGDVLEKIARTNRSSVGEIMQLNQMKSTVLQIGQKLKIPKKGSVSLPTEGGSQGVYTVKQGDNPWTIAVKNHIKLDELLKLNDLDNEKARQLKPGDKLRIR